MTSFRQIQANRRNALKSTGPTSEEGKQQSRCNAVRHGLTAETVIVALEDAEDYKAFETATIIETGLFDIQAEQLLESEQDRQAEAESRKLLYALFRRTDSVERERARP